MCESEREIEAATAAARAVARTELKREGGELSGPKREERDGRKWLTQLLLIGPCGAHETGGVELILKTTGSFGQIQWSKLDFALKRLMRIFRS